MNKETHPYSLKTSNHLLHYDAPMEPLAVDAGSPELVPPLKEMRDGSALHCGYCESAQRLTTVQFPD